MARTLENGIYKNLYNTLGYKEMLKAVDELVSATERSILRADAPIKDVISAKSELKALYKVQNILNNA